MQYRGLGGTGLCVSRMGIGGLPLQRLSQFQVNKLLTVAKELGINFIDTARAYGDSETKIGRALQEDRAHFIIASKSAARTRDGILHSIGCTLRSMNIELIDLYQLHNVATDEALGQVLSPGGALEGLREAKKAGLIRHFGITGHNPLVLYKAVNTGCFATVQAPFNPIELQFLSTLKAAKKQGLGTITMKPLAGGAFKHPDIVLRAELAEEAVDIVIPGADTVRQLRQNANTVDSDWELDETQKAVLAAEVHALGALFCRRCGYCLPCPQGIRIPTILLLDSYFSRYQLGTWAKKRYSRLRSRASRCKGCGICESRCPYGLPVRELLRGAHAKLKNRA